MNISGKCRLSNGIRIHAIFLIISYENLDVDSAVTWLYLNSSHYQIDEIHLLGSAHVAFKNPTNYKANISIDNQRMYGDKSGTWHVGYGQTFNVNITDPDTPLSLQVYEHGELSLPRKGFLKGVSVYLSGKVITNFSHYLTRHMYSITEWNSKAGRNLRNYILSNRKSNNREKTL